MWVRVLHSHALPALSDTVHRQWHPPVLPERVNVREQHLQRQLRAAASGDHHYLDVELLRQEAP
jgi:hypothetical protein